MTNLDQLLLNKGYTFYEKVRAGRFRREVFYYYIKEIDGINFTYEINELHTQILDKYCSASKQSELLSDFTAMQQREYEKIKELI